MNVHEQFAEDLSLYALGCLEGAEKISVETHLTECVSCRHELEQVRGDAALLALSASGPAPPARAKTRLMDTIAHQSRSHADIAKESSSHARLPWWAALGWIAAAALAGMVGVLWTQNARLRQNTVRLTKFVEQQRIQDDKSRRIAEILNAGDARPVALLPVNNPTQTPEGKVVYSHQRGGLIFIASNLDPLPPRKTYQLWLVPSQGSPIPAGVFKPDARGAAMVINPPIPVGIAPKAFAITIEPEQGSTTPTMPIRMMGSAG
jgi:anti-sigma-K factor RskA